MSYEFLSYFLQSHIWEQEVEDSFYEIFTGIDLEERFPASSLTHNTILPEGGSLCVFVEIRRI